MVNNNLERFIGIDIGCTKMRLMAEYEQTFIDHVVPTGLCVTKEYIVQAVTEFINDLPFVPIGIGLAIAGLLDHNTLVASDLKNLEGLQASMFPKTQYGCHFINDVKAAMVCEETYYSDEETLIVIMVGSGLAATIKEKTTVLKGLHGYAGEIGSNPCIIDGKMETLDQISGGNGILAKAGCTITEFLQQIAEKSEPALQIIEQAGFYFGLLLIQLIHTTNPSHIIIGGTTATFPGYMEQALQVVKKYTYPDLYHDCKISKPNDVQRIVTLGSRRYAYICSKCEES